MPPNAANAPRRPLRVLHVEDSEDDSDMVMRVLQVAGFDLTCERVDTQGAFKDALRAKDWDVIISDYSLPRYDGLTALADTREAGKDIPFILVSGTIGETGAVNAMKAGAQDYVLKDGLGRLPLAVEREVREAGVRAELRKASERLSISERMASAGMLAAGVAHEINNPLAVIMTNLDFVRDLVAMGLEGRREHLDASLGDAREAVERIRGIVRDVKLFSRPQDDERGAVDVRTVVESSIRMAWNEIRHRAQLVREFGAVPMVASHEARLGQVLLNLLVNAAQAIPEGHANQNEIRVVTKTAADGRVVIEVRDTGTGIPTELLARIFDPFFTTKPVGVGTGLGLSLCHRMVTDLGGEIAVESEVGKGSLFRVTLPLATRGPRQAPPPKAVADAAGRSRVIIVDDEVAFGRALERSLGRYHDVVTTTSGREALARIASGERFDAIISDLMMPEVTGMEIYDELFCIAPDQAAKMVFLTGGAFTDRARDFLASIPNPCVEKPFELANILEVIAAASRR